MASEGSELAVNAVSALLTITDAWLRLLEEGPGVHVPVPMWAPCIHKDIDALEGVQNSSVTY